MSRLEEAIREGRFVVTAELLTVNTGGLDAVHEHFAPYEPWAGLAGLHALRAGGASGAGALVA